MKAFDFVAQCPLVADSSLIFARLYPHFHPPAMSEKSGHHARLSSFDCIPSGASTPTGMVSTIGLSRSWRRSFSYAIFVAVGLGFCFTGLPKHQELRDPFSSESETTKSWYVANEWWPTNKFEQGSDIGGGSCERCDASPGFCQKYGERAISLTRAYEGSGFRVRRALRKALAGQPIVIGALGGSVSIGHGCECPDKIWSEQVARWWNLTFPHSQNQFVNGAVGARGSLYFSFCHSDYLPENVDLALLEFGTNDDFNEKHGYNMEALLRAVLEYPNKPAALISDSFKLMNGVIGSGSDAHAGVAAYYDVPHLMTRSWVLPAMLEDPSAVKDYFVEMGPFDDDGEPLEPWKVADLLHPNEMGHTMMADMTIAYLEQQLCFIRKGLVTPPSPEFGDWIPDPEILPRQGLGEFFDPDPTVRLQPLSSRCSTVDDPKFHPIESQVEGFHLWQDPDHHDKKYWHAEKEGAKIAFEFESRMGRVGLIWLRSSRLRLGKLRCWVDDEKDKSELLWGWWDNPVSVSDLAVVRDDVKGKHILNCEVAPNPTNGVDAGFRFDIIGIVVCVELAFAS